MADVLTFVISVFVFGCEVDIFNSIIISSSSSSSGTITISIVVLVIIISRLISFTAFVTGGLIVRCLPLFRFSTFHIFHFFCSIFSHTVCPAHTVVTQNCYKNLVSQFLKHIHTICGYSHSATHFSHRDNRDISVLSCGSLTYFIIILQFVGISSLSHFDRP